MYIIYTEIDIEIDRRSIPTRRDALNCLASLSGTDRILFESTKHHVPNIQLYDLNSNG